MPKSFCLEEIELMVTKPSVVITMHLVC